MQQKISSFLTVLGQRLQDRSLQTLLVLTLYELVADWLPLLAHQSLYTISMFMKDMLVWMMPLTVTFFLAKSVRSFGRLAPAFILTLVAFELFSNFSSVWYALFAAKMVAAQSPSISLTALQTDFQALWRIPLTHPSWWSADKGVMAGIILGTLGAFSRDDFPLSRLLSTGHSVISWCLTRIFARLIPLFILGFAANMHQTHLLEHLLTHYAALIMWLVFFLVAYIVFLFAMGADWLPKKILTHMKNLGPAAGMSLTSGCSISTMPWTIEGTGKNLSDPSFARAIIPATTNIQQIGDCITNTFLCFLIYLHFYGTVPSWQMLWTFSIVFVLARFSTAAVLGGAIFIMLPIYETYLNFTPEMIAIILAFNVFLDPIVTCCNVLANGALCRAFEQTWNYLRDTWTPSREPR